MGGGSDVVSPRDQQPPVVSSASCGDIVVNVLHTNGGIGNSRPIHNVRDCAFYSAVYLQRHGTVLT